MDTSSVNLSDVTVLYCEDEDDLRQITSDVIKQFTKNVYLASNGLEGLEIYKEKSEEIDLIVTDVNMPEMSGLEMAKTIKELNSNIPIIVATAFSNSSYLLDAIDIGVDKYVLKPIDIKKLFKVMKQSLMYHELQDLYRDNLTHIANRNALLKHLKQEQHPLIALIDIDDFSIINELYGEDNGDKILLELKDRILNQFNKEDFKTYRVGSDQFVVSVQNSTVDSSALEEMCHKFSHNIDNNEICLDNSGNINISVTIAIAPESNDHNAFENVQRVLNVAKKKFIQIMTYDPNIHETHINFEENLYWIKKLKDGLFDGHFKAFYQPIVDSNTKEIKKYEALIRYIGDDGEIVPPNKFLPIAKKAKLSNKVLKLMLSEVFKAIREKNISVSINISFDDIKLKESRQLLYSQLEQNKDITHMLQFELLETEEIEDFEAVRLFIEEAHKFGCKVGVDDFGAGYSNFNMLEALQVDFVKIDGSLIKKIDSDENQEFIVESITNYTKRTKIETVAEFVSSEDIYSKIKDLGINQSQGWHFGKPLPLEEI